MFCNLIRSKDKKHYITTNQNKYHLPNLFDATSNKGILAYRSRFIHKFEAK